MSLNLRTIYLPSSNEHFEPKDILKASLENIDYKKDSKLTSIFNLLENNALYAARSRHLKIQESKQLSYHSPLECDLKLHEIAKIYRASMLELIKTHKEFLERLALVPTEVQNQLQELSKIDTELQQELIIELSVESINWLNLASKDSGKVETTSAYELLTEKAPYHIHLLKKTFEMEDPYLQQSLKATLDLCQPHLTITQPIIDILNTIREKCALTKRSAIETDEMMKTSNLLAVFIKINGLSKKWSNQDIDDHIDVIKTQKPTNQQKIYRQLGEEIKKFNEDTEQREILIKWITLIALYELVDKNVANFFRDSGALQSLNGIVHAYLGKVKDDTIQAPELIKQTKEIFETWTTQHPSKHRIRLSTAIAFNANERLSIETPPAPFTPTTTYLQLLQQVEKNRIGEQSSKKS